MNKDIDISNATENIEYLKDDFITEYIIGKNHRECLYNLFKLHNESVNSWTMICSNLLSIFIIIYIFIKNQIGNLYDYIFILHVFAYTIHTPFSVGYHTFNCINENEFIKWRKYDVYGIFLRNIILTFTLSFFTYNNFKFTLINTSITIIIVYYSLLKFKENENKNKQLDKLEQSKLIGYTVVSYLFPVLYTIYTSLLNKNYDLTFKISLILIFSVIFGGFCYCFRIPEIFFKPGTFNKIGSSHNLMHMFIIIGVVCETLYIFTISKKGNYIKSFK